MGFCFGRQLLAKKPASAGQLLAKKPASAGFFMGNAFICHDEMRIVVSFSPIPESTHHKGHKIW
ncbi:hypothetical protein LTSEUGA_4698 [Salmonella enterica subsp. enterica serovar Uganda str. R8-3404]|uniref:Uncharacterized protein n=1 Tax=Salmonella enterica subsp. enterica serovar Uganda str. R8-3404 TaxID=913083 RepID=A0A6C8GYS5_SALET|nr:hypothetical protein LTSEUGA_4698 [Salmonella enterica subsp. enterica serovar Uganda str. R8-3404]